MVDQIFGILILKIHINHFGTLLRYKRLFLVQVRYGFTKVKCQRFDSGSRKTMYIAVFVLSKGLSSVRRLDFNLISRKHLTLHFGYLGNVILKLSQELSISFIVARHRCVFLVESYQNL